MSTFLFTTTTTTTNVTQKGLISICLFESVSLLSLSLSLFLFLSGGFVLLQWANWSSQLTTTFLKIGSCFCAAAVLPALLGSSIVSATLFSTTNAQKKKKTKKLSKVERKKKEGLPSVMYKLSAKMKVLNCWRVDFGWGKIVLRCQVDEVSDWGIKLPTEFEDVWWRWEEWSFKLIKIKKGDTIWWW